MPKKFYDSVGHALRGLIYSFRTQRNFRIHVLLAAVAILLSLILKISALEFSILLLSMSAVIVLELINTAVEEVVNMLALMRKIRAKVAKDVSAAAVLIAACTAFFIGVLIFIPKIIDIIKKGF